MTTDVRALCVMGLLIAIASPCAAQQPTPGFPHPNTDYAEPDPPLPPVVPATSFVMPDVPDAWNQFTMYDGHRFSVRFSAVGILDYNAFSRDDESVKQVGEQANQWDLRTWRLMARGRLKFAHPVDYFVSLEVKGKDHVVDGDSKMGFTDLEISTEAWKLGTLHYGKIKEPIVYEMVGDAANLQQQERALSPFFASRGIGLRLSKPFANDTMTYTVGWFNDWYVQGQHFKESGNDFAAASRTRFIPGCSGCTDVGTRSRPFSRQPHDQRCGGHHPEDIEPVTVQVGGALKFQADNPVRQHERTGWAVARRNVPRCRAFRRRRDPSLP
jgi:hypothetical protein